MCNVICVMPSTNGLVWSMKKDLPVRSAFVSTHAGRAIVPDDLCLCKHILCWIL